MVTGLPSSLSWLSLCECVCVYISSLPQAGLFFIFFQVQSEIVLCVCVTARIIRIIFVCTVCWMSTFTPPGEDVCGRGANQTPALLTLAGLPRSGVSQTPPNTHGIMSSASDVQQASAPPPRPPAVDADSVEVRRGSAGVWPPFRKKTDGGRCTCLIWNHNNQNAKLI